MGNNKKNFTTTFTRKQKCTQKPDTSQQCALLTHTLSSSRSHRLPHLLRRVPRTKSSPNPNNGGTMMNGIGTGMNTVKVMEATRTETMVAKTTGIGQWTRVRIPEAEIVAAKTTGHGIKLVKA